MLDFEAGGSSICEEREVAGHYSAYPFSECGAGPILPCAKHAGIIRYNILRTPGFGILGTSYRSLLLLSKQSERLVAMGSSRRCKVSLGSVFILWVSPLLLRET